jgi:hypothetical protein
MNSPGFGFETELSGGIPGRTDSRRVSSVETKAQGGNVDLVMVAKASLRASERPFRVSGSGRMHIENAFFATTRRMLKSIAGERETTESGASGCGLNRSSLSFKQDFRKEANA